MAAADDGHAPETPSAKRRRDRRRTAAPLDARAILKKELQDVFYQNKSHDEIVCFLEANRSDKQSKDKDAKGYVIVVTVNTAVKGAKYSLGLPKFHVLKAKGSVYYVKKFYLLKTLESVDGRDTKEQEFSLVFNGHKTIQWIPHDPKQRNDFLWWLMQTCKVHLRYVVPTSLDPLLLSAITNDWIHKLVAPETSSTAMSGLNEIQKQMLRALKDGKIDGKTGNEKDKQNSAEGGVHVEVPPMTKAEEKDILELLSQSGLALSDIDKLEDHLRGELKTLENDNIKALFLPQNRKVTDTIAAKQNDAGDMLEGMGLWMRHHDHSLNKMRTGIEQIETRNTALEIQSHNYEKLQNQLGKLISELALKPDVRRHLEEPNFRTGLEGALRAVGQLDSAIRLNLQDGLENMQAVRDQRANNDKLKKDFSLKAAKHLETVFVETSTEARSNRQVNNSNVHTGLQRYSALAKFLERLEPDLFTGLRPKYTSLVAPVYRDKIKAFFPALKDATFKDGRDVRIDSFPEYVLDKKGSRQDIKVVRPVAPVGKKLVTTAFSEALVTFAQVIQSEQDFMLGFFGLHSAEVAAATNPMSPSAAPPPGHRHTQSSSQVLPSAAALMGSGSSAGAAAAAGAAPIAAASAAAGGKEEKRKLDGESLQNRIDVRKMLEIVFKGLEEHLIELAESGDKMDHFYALEMLVATEKVIDDYQKCEYYVGVLTSVSTTLMLRWNRFIDEEIKWVEGYRVGAKRSGVLTPFAKFPCFVERLDAVVKGARCQAADTSLFKLWNALDHCVKVVAESSEKYMNVVYTENYHFFYRVFVSREKPIPALAKAMALCDVKYHQSLLRYLDWSVGHEMPAVSAFWKKIEETLKVRTADQLQYTPELSKADLKVLFSKSFNKTKLAEHAAGLWKRLNKHIEKNSALLEEVWERLVHFWIGRIEWFAKTAADCYREPIGVTAQEIQIFCDKFMPTGGGRKRNYSFSKLPSRAGATASAAHGAAAAAGGGHTPEHSRNGAPDRD